MTERKLKLGTRRSALAWAQSSWVAREIEKRNPGIKVELVGIETQGDRIVDVPLRQVEGKEFFTAEVDQALLDGSVHLTVHSLKDLSLERPEGLRLAAVPPRANPRDAILFGPRSEEKLREGLALKIGTSAPRRLENLPGLLKRVLPFGAGASLEWVEIRGNVDTRLKRLHEPESSDRFLDAIVLSLAGLSRLWHDQDAVSRGNEKLASLLPGLRWLVAPLSECPSAPGQGALAVECRVNDDEAYHAIRTLHDPPSHEDVLVERAVLAEFGGGCHQRFGAAQMRLGGNTLLYIRGRAQDGRFLNERRWSGMPPRPNHPVSWDGSAAQCFDYSPTEQAASLEKRELAGAVFVAHARALPDGAEAALHGRRVWVSGLASWQKLAERGIWVEGCAESLGFAGLLPTLLDPVLQLPPLSGWTVLTHDGASESWDGPAVVPTYSLKPRKHPEPAIPSDVTHVFWSSGSQFGFSGAKFPDRVHHACGPGKTAVFLAERGVKNLTVFPSAKEWRKWLGLPDVE